MTVAEIIGDGFESLALSVLIIAAFLLGRAVSRHRRARRVGNDEGTRPVRYMPGNTMPTFDLMTISGYPAIYCRLCGSVSYHPNDRTARYCGACRLFHDAVAEGRRLVAAGGTHDCGEWRTAAGVCALCRARVTEP